MPNDALVQSLRARLPDDAHLQMFEAALAALAASNRLRAQHFAVSLRELFGHVLSSRASDEAVRNCVWYTQEQGARGPTRRQRALYLSRGGLSDEFLRNLLNLEPDDFHSEIKDAFDELNKYSHVRPNTVPTKPDEIENFANLAIGSLDEVFDVIDDVRSEIERAIEPHLQNEAASVFVRETIKDLNIFGGYTTEGVLFDEARVLNIGSEHIEYRLAGTVDVQLHFGGRSDPVEIDETFPFVCTIVAKVEEPFNFLSDMTVMEVDTSGWDGYDEEEEDVPGGDADEDDDGNPKTGGLPV